MKKFCLIVLFAFSVFGVYITISPIMDDFKVRAAPYLSYFSIRNNPLFPQLDPDSYQLQFLTRVGSKEIKSRGSFLNVAIDAPEFDSVDQTPFKDEEMVIGVFYNGEAKAYPYPILLWHEVVNDQFAGQAVSVTLCPYCDTNPVFLTGQNGPLAVSGKMFQSGLVIYDSQTKSLWSQPMGLAISGTHVHESLERIPGYKTTLGQWKKRHPDTQVLSTRTGFRRNYFKNPYRSYAADQSTVFPVRNLEKCSSHPKAIVSYIWKSDGKEKFNHFSGFSRMVYHDVMKEIKEETFYLDKRVVKAKWDETLGTVRFIDQGSGEEIPSSTAYAFAYFALFNS